VRAVLDPLFGLASLSFSYAVLFKRSVACSYELKFFLLEPEILSK